MDEKELAAALAEPAALVKNWRHSADTYAGYIGDLCSLMDSDDVLKLGRENSLFLSNHFLCAAVIAGGAKSGELDADRMMSEMPEIYTNLSFQSFLYAWKLGKNAYQIDSDALTAILSAPLPEKLCSWQLLNRLREYCLYISFDWQRGSTIKYRAADDSQTLVKGVFVQLDGSFMQEGGIVLNFMIVTAPDAEDNTEIFSMTVSHCEELFCGIGKDPEFQWTQEEREQLSFTKENGADAELIRDQVVKILAYIIADNHDLKRNGAEIDWSDHDSMRPKAKKVKGGFKFFPLDKSSVYSVGEKLGEEVRAKLARGISPNAIKGHFTVEVNPSMEPGDDTLTFALDE